MAENRQTKKPSKKAAAAEPKIKRVSKSKAVKAQQSGGFAIIETGGKQYRVAEGDTLKVEKIGDLKVGDAIVFDKVLLIDNGADVTDIGTPYIDGAKVSGTLIEIGRNKKVVVLKYKPKSRYLKKNGHRQPFFKVKIEKIS